MRPLFFGAIDHTELKHDYIQKNRTDWEIPLPSVEQRKDLEAVRLQPQRQVRNQPGTLIRGWVAFDVKIKEYIMRPLDEDNQLTRSIMCGLL